LCQDTQYRPTETGWPLEVYPVFGIKKWKILEKKIHKKFFLGWTSENGYLNGVLSLKW